MKRIAMFLIASLCFGGQAFATLMHDLETNVSVSFSHQWDYYTSTVEPNIMTGTGQYTQSYYSGLAANPLDSSLFQYVGVTTTVGDDALSQYGTQRINTSILTTFTFDFGDISTDLVVTNYGYGGDSTISRDTGWNGENGTGEHFAGVYGSRILLDEGYSSQLFYWQHDILYSDLTGQHDITIRSSLNNQTVASYPYIPAPVPEPATMFLFATGLAQVHGPKVKHSIIS